jgi:DNA-binding NtrC family response regulator
VIQRKEHALQLILNRIKVKVIIVEDEMLIAQVTKMQLEKNGFEVGGMARSAEGFWQMMNDSVDVVLLDVKLKKNESGIDLAHDIKAKYPELPIVFTTGNTRNFVEKEVGNMTQIEVLNKPLVYSDLINLLRQMA